MTAPELQALGVIDGIIPEPEGGAHMNPQRAIQAVDEAIYARLTELMRLQGKALSKQRVQKFRRMSAFERAQQPAARQEKES